jgi:hypothetical protein
LTARPTGADNRGVAASRFTRVVGRILHNGGLFWPVFVIALVAAVVVPQYCGR